MALDEQHAPRERLPPDAHASAPRPYGIALCLSHFHPTVGGAERQMLQLARAWHQQGHPVHVFTRSVPGQPSREAFDGLIVHRSIRTLSFGPLFGLSYLVTLFLSLWRSRREYAIVLAGQASWEAVAAAMAARWTGKPFVVRAASTGPTGELAQLAGSKGSRFWLRLLRRADRFVATSSEARRQFLEIGCPEQRVMLAHNGVDLSRFHTVHHSANRSAAVDPTALFVGRLVDIKRPLDLLEAWRLATAGRRGKLLVVGDGPLRDSMTSFARQHQLANVEFAGQQDDVAPWYQRADVFLLFSTIEGSSNALLEAMASGLCPVVTRVGGNLDLVEQEVSGLLVEPGNPAELAKAIARVFDDADLRRRLAAEARSRAVRDHDLDRVAEWYLRLFTDVMN